MLNKAIRILNFDNSVAGQKALIARYDHTIIDLTDIGHDARFWITQKVRAAVDKRITGENNSVTFIGSGDFHHISEILINRFEEPITVIDFDFHPDWEVFFKGENCGSWVSEVLKRKSNVLKIVLLGMGSRDISSFLVQTGNLNALKNDRVEIYPYRHKPSLMLLQDIPANISVKSDKKAVLNTLYWNELKDKDLKSFTMELIERLPSKKVYVSIDKDCLKKEHAITNWEEGQMSLGQLCSMLRLINENTDIIALDITGDHSDIVINDPVKRCISYFDHPKDATVRRMDQAYITGINERTNLEILETLNI